MLHIEELSIVRGQGEQAHHVFLPQLDLRQGQIIAVTGESGCGKSTLLESIGLLLRPHYVGRFELGKPSRPLDVAALLNADKQPELADIRSRQLGFVLQNGGLLPYLTVRDNIKLPCQLLDIKPDQAILERVLSTLKLAPLLNKYPAHLSFGERQRAAFARAILHRPWLILADEPTAALDPYNAQQLFSLFIELVREEGMMALMVCHDWTLVKQFGLPCLNASLDDNPMQHLEIEGNVHRGTYFVL